MAPAKLLLVDDDETVLTGLGTVLEAHEFEVVTASSAAEALRRIASESFDVVLSDLHMPGDGDGLTVVSAMRHTNPNAVTLLLSANPDMTKASTAILRQVDEIVQKPVNAGQILQVINQRLTEEGPLPRSPTAESTAAVLQHESASVTKRGLKR